MAVRNVATMSARLVRGATSNQRMANATSVVPSKTGARSATMNRPAQAARQKEDIGLTLRFRAAHVSKTRASYGTPRS